MKTLTNYIVSFFCVVAVITLAATYSSSKTTTVDTADFTLQNNLVSGIGNVLISETNGGSSVMNVNSSGPFTQNIDSPVASITIGGNVINAGQNTTMTLSDGRKIKVTWTSPTIVIVDANEL